jgi:mono/diheme cytochrome c family protein
MDGMKIRIGLIGVGLVVLVLGLTLVNGWMGTERQVVAQEEGEAPAMSGEALFNEYCMVCHGVKGAGGMGPPLNVPPPPEVAELSPEERMQVLTNLLRNGIPAKMPAFTDEQFTDEQIPAIGAYLGSIKGTLTGTVVYEALPPITAEEVAEGHVFFAETGHSVGGDFLAYWQEQGGLERFGYPLSEEYMGMSPIDGQPYMMQLFERVRMEYHPELPEGERVKLALLGAEEIQLRTFFMQQGHDMEQGHDH